MSGVLVACLLVEVFAFFMLYRNHVTYRICGEALRIVAKRAMEMIDAGHDGWETLYDLLNQRSYESILWDPFCWRVEQAYPWIVALMPEKPKTRTKVRVLPRIRLK